MATYYVDATTGSDLDDGLSEGNAWATMSKVGSTTLAGDDIVLLKRGEVWRETLTPGQSGTSGHLITFGAYGSGALPTVKASDAIATTGWSNSGGGSSNVTVSIAASGADGYVQQSAATYPPGGSTTVNTSGGSIPVERGFNGGVHVVRVGLLRFDTSVLSGETVLSAVLRIQSRSSEWFDSDGRNLVGEWYDPGTIDSADYTATSASTAFSEAITGIAKATGDGSQVDFTLTDAATEIDTAGFTGLRIHVDGGEPTGRNGVGMASLDHASTPEPKLIVTIDALSAMYERAMATTPGDGHVLEDGVKLTRQTSTAAVEANAGSWYWAANVLYLHATDGTDPTSNGKVYEASQRSYCINGAGRDYLRFESIKVAHSKEEGLRSSSTSDFWEWDGCVGENCGWQGLKVDGTGHTMIDCSASGSRRFAGIGVDQQGSTDHTITDSVVHDNGVDWWADHGFYASSAVGSGDVIFRGCTAYGNSAMGFKAGGVTDVSVRIFRYCVAYNNGHSGFFNEDSITKTVWQHCTSNGNANGFHNYNAAATVAEIRNCIATNNLFDDTNDAGHSQTGRGFYNNGGTITTRDYNLFDGNDVRGVTAAANEVDADPLFTDVGTADFTLTDLSPAIDAGVVIAGIDQTVNGAAPDIGAFESSDVPSKGWGFIPIG
jgi:hypothetical protein